MESGFNIEIKDLGVINEASININKINVVGGINNSGKSSISKLLYCSLKSSKSIDELLENQGYTDFKSENIIVNSNESFSDIFYLESISILDLKDSQFLNLDHIRHIKECLEIENENVDETTSNILTKIEGIVDSDCGNVLFSSAGIKQIKLIELLLKNRSLRKNSFLIIDEPESNLHPAWQVKFAHILILLTKELNTTLYLNSHSPIFIETVSLYAQYYDLLNKTNFYLTERQANGKFNFKKINPKNMGEVYENLTSPYDELDKLKAKILFRE